MRTKDFRKELNFFLQKIKNKESFAFIRFSDGEQYILDNQELKLDEGLIQIGDTKQGGIYKPADYKHFDPIKHSHIRELLMNSFLHKQNEYYKFEVKYDFWDSRGKTYEEMGINRNSSINHRSDWMNTEEFINYENVSFKYHIECDKLDKEWEKYDASKTRGNSKCPLCRA